MLICRSLNTRVQLLNQSINESEKMSYIAPTDETKFWLYEILEVQRLFSISNYHDLKREDFDLILSEAAKITSVAENHIDKAASKKRAVKSFTL